MGDLRKLVLGQCIHIIIIIMIAGTVLMSKIIQVIANILQMTKTKKVGYLELDHRKSSMSTYWCTSF